MPSQNYLNAIACFNLGSLYQKNGEYQKASENFEKALEIDPTLVNTYVNYALVLEKTGQIEKAVKLLKKVVSIDPSYQTAKHNLAILYVQQGILYHINRKYHQSLQCFFKALQVNPDFPQVYFNLGNVYSDLGHSSLAINSYQKAIQLSPDFYDAYHNLGLVCINNGQSQRGIESLRHVPNPTPHLVFELFRICAWKEAGKLYQRLIKLKVQQPPFFDLTMHSSDAKNYQTALSWSQKFTTANINFHYLRPAKKIKIAYLSDGFRDFPTAHNLAPVLEHHDKDQFEIYAISYGARDRSDWRRRVVNSVDKFINIETQSDTEAAVLINKEKINILVDLKGHTKNNRLGIFARRPAPVQVNYLGYPGTTGADFIDYIIADKIVIPPSAQKYYTEKVVYLPHCYRPADTGFKAPLPSPKSHQPFVFASFNHTYKIRPPLFLVWMRILKKLPRSVLWQLESTSEAVDNLKAEAKLRGIDPARIVFVPILPKRQHLDRVAQANIVLDSYPVNGHTTTVDALMSKVPVITLMGNHFASRVSASILTAAALPQLITHSLSEYENLALNLALRPEKIPPIVLTSPLFNIQQYTQNLENAYHKIWNIYIMNHS